MTVQSAQRNLAGKASWSVYLIHGTADQLIAAARSENISEALGGEKEIRFVEGAGHARSIRHARREYSERLTRFFSERLEG